MGMGRTKHLIFSIPRKCHKLTRRNTCSMLKDRMIRTFERKLYLTASQSSTLDGWMRTCCSVYNRALEHRIKAYRRRGESVSLYDQYVLLTGQRARIERLRIVPAIFERDAISRVDRGFKAFFRRTKKGLKSGFPRFRPHYRYSSIECAVAGKYFKEGFVRIPTMGRVKSRGGGVPSGIQKALRVIRRASGWFAQVVVDDGDNCPEKSQPHSPVGVDVGLNVFAAFSTGEMAENPRCGRKSAADLRFSQRRLARRKKGSQNRAKAVLKVRRIHERITAQRRDFAHQLSRRLVNRYDLIAFEKLNIRGMVRNRRLARSIMDAAWGMFTRFVTYKAECAGRHAIAVPARGTSQECPWCGAIKAKALSERIHQCNCRPGVVIDRDHAAAMVILSRALRGNGGVTPAEEFATTRTFHADGQAVPEKQVCASKNA